MSTTNGKASATALSNGRSGPILDKELVGVVTLAGNLSVTSQYRRILKLDPNGAHRDVTLSADAAQPGAYYRIVNAADAAENLVVKNAAGSTIGTVNQNEEGEFWYDPDSDAWILIRIATIALA